MRAATCFSGIGAPECALPDWQWLWSSEVAPFPNEVRAVRFPHSENLGDVMAEDFVQRASSFGALDVLMGGPPCQDFSVAGLRAGLDGARGNLSLRWVQIIHALRPRWAVTENVPGWLSVNRGHAFGAFLAGLVGHDTAILPPKECGGRWTDAGMVAGPAGRAAWRVLDAQYFGLAQRRRRVFVVSDLGDGGDPAAVLLERSGLRGDRPPRREAGERASPTLSVRTSAGGGLGADHDLYGGLIMGDDVDRCFDASEDGTRRGVPLVPACAFDARQNAVLQYGPISGPLDTDGQSIGLSVGSDVRRLTPTECERLQGFPDGYTLVPYRGKPAADGPRYQALGNSMAVPVMAWIGRRIQMIETSMQRSAA